MKPGPIIDHIVNWLSDYCDQAGMNGFVVGVSGGIDSAVTSSLCAKTGKKVILLNMPIHQKPEQYSLSARHIARLSQSYSTVTSVEVNLTPAFQTLENALPEEIRDPHTMANTRARMRMLTLYAFSTHHRMLVAGTGNKVEDFGIGFYTKYGDGGVDLSPIADLKKTEVYALGKELGVMEDILRAPPTDGLWEDGRTDETQIGAAYEELEWAMDFEKKPEEESLLTRRQKEVLAIFRKFHRANRHKMEPIPICNIPNNFK